MHEYAVTDPATGEIVATYPCATEFEIGEAISLAVGAAAGWVKESSVAQRVARIRRVVELHVSRRDALADIIVREVGKRKEEALAEVDICISIYEYYADNAETFLADEPVELLAGAGYAVVRRGPLGVLLGIMPWNFPYYQVARFAGPNILAGNTILLKHAPQCPESAMALQQIFLDAGFPQGVYVDIRATNDQVADIIADPRVAAVSLTGSERAGAAVAEIAGRNLKKVVLELGGSDPFIVLSTDNLDEIVEAAVAVRLYNAGQACNAAKRFLVVGDLYDEFVEKFTDMVLAATEGFAPLSSVRAAENLEQQVARAVEQGATLESAGVRRGAYFPPGVLTDVTPENDIYREELFGPVAMVFRVESEDEAVAVANGTLFGLGSYIFTTDPDQAQRVADRIEAGMVFINGIGADSAELPFGGIKRSGFGRELGKFGIDEFVNKKLIRTVV